jgi:hypothetical protein
MPHDVFISYSSHDKAVADAICGALEAPQIKIRCWIAPRDVLGGMEYANEIVNAINGCRVMVLVFSASANSSPDVGSEVHLAFSKEKVIVPFRIEDILPEGAMEYRLSKTHWLDALTPPLEMRISELVTSVGRLLTANSEPVSASIKDTHLKRFILKPIFLLAAGVAVLLAFCFVIWWQVNRDRIVSRNPAIDSMAQFTKSVQESPIPAKPGAGTALGPGMLKADALMKQYSQSQLTTSGAADLSVILDYRAQKIDDRLSQHTNDIEVLLLKEKLDTLRVKHKAAITDGKLLLAHEILREIDGILADINLVFQRKHYSTADDPMWTRFWFVPDAPKNKSPK